MTEKAPLAPSPASTLAQRFAFVLRPDRVACRRAVWSAAAALTALAAAIALGLDSPYWAAMTVWIVAQPTRGMLIGKCLARLAGTAAGVVAALPLLHVADWTQTGFVVVLAVWVGGCAAVANLLTGFRAYAALLAGYTAPLVALVAVKHPEQAVLLAGDRIACIVIGVAASALLTWFATPEGDSGVLRERAARTAREAARWVLSALSAARYDDVGRIEARLIADMADIDAQCDAGGSGSAAARRERRAVRELLGSVLTAMAAARALYAFRLRGAAALSAFADALPADTPDDEKLSPRRLAERLEPLLRDAAPAPGQMPTPRHHVLRLRDALAAIEDRAQRLSDDGDAARSLHFVIAVHPDWRHARRAGLRTFATLLGLGLGWEALGWPLLEGALIGASILCSVFSTFEAPKSGIFRAVEGTAVGTAAAAVCALGLLPFAASLPALLLALTPFMLVGGLALANRPTAMAGLDYSMVFLLLTAPAMPVMADRAHFLAMTPGPILGALAAAAAFHFILPTDPARRLRDLHDLIQRETRRLSDLNRPVAAERWRAMALHRALRLTLRSEAAGRGGGSAVRAAQASLNLGEDLLLLRRRLCDGAPDQADLADIRDLLVDLTQKRRPNQALSAAFDAAAQRLLATERASSLATLLTGIAAGLSLSPDGAEA